MSKQFHRFIENIENKRIKAVDAWFQKETAAQKIGVQDRFKAELDKRYNYFITGGTMVAGAEAQKSILELMKRIN